MSSSQRHSAAIYRWHRVRATLSATPPTSVAARARGVAVLEGLEAVAPGIRAPCAVLCPLSSVLFQALVRAGHERSDEARMQHCVWGTWPVGSRR